jgi:hypothetical protein
MEVMPDPRDLLIFGRSPVQHPLVGTAVEERSSPLPPRELSWLHSRLPTLWANHYLVATVRGALLAVIKH